jgi:hypothetical protein
MDPKLTGKVLTHNFFPITELIEEAGECLLKVTVLYMVLSTESIFSSYTIYTKISHLQHVLKDVRIHARIPRSCFAKSTGEKQHYIWTILICWETISRFPPQPPIITNKIVMNKS